MKSHIDIQTSWNLRRLANMADNAVFGLLSYKRGAPDNNLLRQGAALCEILTTLPESSAKKAILNISRDLGAASARPAAAFPFKTEDWSSVLERVQRVRSLLQRLPTLRTSNPTEAAEVDEAQKTLDGFASLFYQADVSNLRRLKQRKGLKAYGPPSL